MAAPLASLLASPTRPSVVLAHGGPGDFQPRSTIPADQTTPRAHRRLSRSTSSPSPRLHEHLTPSPSLFDSPTPAPRRIRTAAGASVALDSPAPLRSLSGDDGASLGPPASNHGGRDERDWLGGALEVGVMGDADPMSALGGRSTPFFMLGMRDGGEEPEEGGQVPHFVAHGHHRTSYGTHDSSAVTQTSTPALGTSVHHDGSYEVPAHVNTFHQRNDCEHRTGAHLAALHSPPVQKVELAALTTLVTDLDARLSTLHNLAGDLSSRVVYLENVGQAREAEFAAFRRSLSPAQTAAHVRSAERSRPSLSSYSAYPHSFPDGSYSTGESDREGLTPPASPQLTRAAHAPPQAESAHSHSYQYASSSAFAQRNRSVSLGSLAFAPLDASLVPPSQVPNAYAAPSQDLSSFADSSASYPHAGYSSLGHFYSSSSVGRYGNSGYFTGPGASFPSVAASLQNHLADVSTGQEGGAGSSGGMHVNGGEGRERAASMAALPSGGRWASEGDGFQRQPYRHSESPNYRTLLDSDADIDDEAFVRRILVHNDQQCSLFLQQRVRLTTPDKKYKLCQAVGKQVLDMSLSKFGNFLVSRCLEASDAQLAQSYEEALQGHFLALSLDPFGCHVVQKLLDYGGAGTKNRVIEELLPHSQILTTKSSLHVLNRILTFPNPIAFYRRLADLGTGQWASIVKDDGGSLVVQHLLEDWCEASASVVAREILEALGDVAKTACGSFLLDRNSLPFCTKIMQLGPALAQHHFAAKLVDKCLKPHKAGPAGIAAFVDAIVSSSGGSAPPLVAIASHSAGAQLLSNLLLGPAATATLKAKLSRCLAEHEAALKAEAGAHGARLVGLSSKAGSSA
ncbi:hypothetical protein Rhopal_007705-T1 [Rhodotorula paludigena]|uniref:PUM-HD domain-containing protein n=1 Tax=Rhodotorula paludigena TaxID=86838 RepID=A0AAV5GYK4_9BASI|nr:hypothetical protein Rhopal_007705-T1 [Rhodotorula paludigena]